MRQNCIEGIARICDGFVFLIVDDSDMINDLYRDVRFIPRSTFELVEKYVAKDEIKEKIDRTLVEDDGYAYWDSYRDELIEEIFQGKFPISRTHILESLCAMGI